MNLFFITPWPARDPLSRATVEPHLQTLASDRRVQAIHYFTTESATGNSALAETARHAAPIALFPKVHHHPLPACPRRLRLITRIQSHHRHQRRILTVAAQHHPDLVFCRGTAGIFGDMLHRGLGIPYIVESFEPHAHYMLQTGTWSRWDPKFLVQRSWEERIKRSAAALITVSHGYAHHLREVDGISPQRLHTVPCWVDADRFRLDAEVRARVRRQLGIGDQLAVVYAGKFGGIYAPLEELGMLRTLQEALGRPLFAIILTANDAEGVRHQLARSGIGPDSGFVDCLAYEQVGAYLNAADLALSFWSSGPWSFACSPIKHGESWACGLPLLMPPGIGNEAQWLEAERAGAMARFADPSSVRAAARRIQAILAEPSHRARIRAIALRERGPEPLKQVYGQLLKQFSAERPSHG